MEEEVRQKVKFKKKIGGHLRAGTFLVFEEFPTT